MLILECCFPHKAAKQFVCEDRQWRKESDYDCGTWYWVEQFEPRSLDDLTDLVSVCRALPSHYVVRGKLSPLGAKLVASGRIIRRCHIAAGRPGGSYSWQRAANRRVSDTITDMGYRDHNVPPGRPLASISQARRGVTAVIRP